MRGHGSLLIRSQEFVKHPAKFYNGSCDGTSVSQ